MYNEGRRQVCSCRCRVLRIRLRPGLCGIVIQPRDRLKRAYQHIKGSRLGIHLTGQRYLACLHHRPGPQLVVVTNRPEIHLHACRPALFTRKVMKLCPLPYTFKGESSLLNNFPFISHLQVSVFQFS